jgi:hypothetical protein
MTSIRKELKTIKKSYRSSEKRVERWWGALSKKEKKAMKKVLASNEGVLATMVVGAMMNPQYIIPAIQAGRIEEMKLRGVI